MDVLVFGGSFDPPHDCHVKMLRAALKKLRPATAYIVAAHHSPLKSAAQAGGRARLQMVRTALRERLTNAELKKVRVLEFEVLRNRMTYTYETLRYLSKRHPSARLYFLLGSDTAAGFRDWKKTSEIRDLCRFIIGRRPGVELNVEKAGLPKHAFLKGIFPDVSSTEIRARLIITGGVSCPDLAPGVLKHIRSKKLYQTELRARVQKLLGPGRFAHTVSMAETSVLLARRHGMDVERAALAGMLHDVGRSVPTEKMTQYVRDNRLDVSLSSQIAKRQPMLFHAHISEDIARRRFGVSDPDVLSAVRKHTLGDIYMSPFDRLIYTADACSPDRRFPEARRIFNSALRDIDAAFLETVKTKLGYVLRAHGWIHSSGIGLWNKLVSRDDLG